MNQFDYNNDSNAHVFEWYQSEQKRDLEETNNIYYGCPEHTLFGDEWYYNNIAGAW